METTVIHFMPLAYNSNVRCLNGSAHAKYSSDINEVTCALCRNPETFKTHWAIVENLHRTKHQFSPITGKRFERYTNN